MKHIFDRTKGKAVARKKQFSLIPGVFDHKTMLYIGASPDRFELIDLIFAHDYEIDVLEIWEKNINRLKKINDKYHIFRTLFHGDVRFCTQFFEADEYDIVLWWHGPEHLEELEIPDVLKNLEKIAKHLAIMGCPWGKFPQKAVKGNPHEAHKSYLYPAFFVRNGYNYSTIKKPDKRGGNILAWKRV